jgi:hypothetical protein
MKIVTIQRSLVHQRVRRGVAVVGDFRRAESAVATRYATGLPAAPGTRVKELHD